MLTFELGKMTASERMAVMSREGFDLAKAIEKARPIVEKVRQKGDDALLSFARKLDGFKGTRLTLPESEITLASKRAPKELVLALQTARKRIEQFHSRQGLKPFEYADACGVLGQKVVPLRRVGIYVPGGAADYASTVLMAVVPARLAGVKEIAMCTPGRGGAVPDSILTAAGMCGITEVHPVGGAHAIAALAYGTKSIKKVQKIVGPGGAVVSAAKLLVRNDCEIDFLAGPSEILIVADSQADPELVASDILAQLEHDPLARGIVVTDSRSLAAGVRKALERQMAKAERREIARRAAESGAMFVIASSMGEAMDFANEYAPEHLLLDVQNPDEMLESVENAGSVFLGGYSSVAFGDYCSGTNHILPTKGTASMRSSLSVYDFLKIIPYQSISPDGAAKLAPVVDRLARSEGLPSHADAALLRAKRVNR